MKIFSIFIKLIISIILVFIFLNGLIYVQTKIFTFPPPIPFSGDSLLNPYQDIGNKTVKCNFHAHSKAWKGITNGHNTPLDLTEAYKKHGYGVAGVSNYHCITDSVSSNSLIYIPVYEHGINIKKSHLLGIDANKPSYFDFPLWQNTSQKQQIINDIRNNNGLVTIAHPKFLNGHTIEDMAQLTNYQFVEVLNHYRISDEYWDAALTAGRLVYGLGNDDTHDINNEPTFRMWTEVYAHTATKEGVLDALIKGRAFMYHSYDGGGDGFFSNVKTSGDTIDCWFTGKIDTVEVWGPNHILLSKLKLGMLDMEDSLTGFKHGKYILPKNIGYARLVGKASNCAIYLNPIVRSVNGKTSGVERLVPEIDVTKTWFYRLCVLLVELLTLILFLYIWKLKPFNR